MVDRQSEVDSNHPCRAAVVAPCGTRGVERTTLPEEIRRRLLGSARHLKVDVDTDSSTVLLEGMVPSFYAKQLLYHLCRQSAPGFQVIDATVVGPRPTAAPLQA